MHRSSVRFLIIENSLKHSTSVVKSEHSARLGSKVLKHLNHSTFLNYRQTIFTKANCLNKMAANTSSTLGTVFVGKIDRYKGVHVKSSDEPCDVTQFHTKLQSSLTNWQKLQIRAAWFLVSLDHSSWVPELAKNGFRYHHVEGDSISMVRWLAEEESRIPVYAHTMIGAGAVVVDAQKRLLVVQERYSDILYWKLPGGYVEPGENIPDAAMREVLEETNIKTEFRNMIAFRHAHGAPFGCSDIYFIVELAPLSSDIVKEDLEVEDCQWMEIDTFLNHPSVHENNRLFLRKYLFSKESGVSINGVQTLHPVSKAHQMLYALESRKD